MAKDKTAETPPANPLLVAAPVLTKARVLVTGSFGTADDVVSLPAEDIAQGAASGQIDPHPDAVAYAESLAA
jgi:hypothetical protein